MVHASTRRNFRGLSGRTCTTNNYDDRQDVYNLQVLETPCTPLLHIFPTTQCQGRLSHVTMNRHVNSARIRTAVTLPCVQANASGHMSAHPTNTIRLYIVGDSWYSIKTLLEFLTGLKQEAFHAWR